MAASVSFLDKAGLKAFWDHIKTALIDPITGTNGTLTTHIANKSNPHGVTKAQVGLANVTNDAQVKRSEMGKASGVATLGTDGKIPSSQLPSYVDDVIEGYYNPTDKKFYTQKGTDGNYAQANLITGEAGKIYVDLGTDDNVIYRYAGASSTYVPISDVPAAVMEKINDLASAMGTKASTTDLVALKEEVEDGLNYLDENKADKETVNDGMTQMRTDLDNTRASLANTRSSLAEQGITYDSASRKLTITLYCGPVKDVQSFEIDGVSDTDINALK